jgi:starch phosphorylase/maltose phosphorylase
MHPELDPDALTIGFARRFATYKRAPLIFRDLERARTLFADDERPIQLLYAGKAHPADDGGKRFIQRIYEYSQQEGFAGKVVFLEGYDMQIGRMLVSGCDVWLNNPRRPLEASGTSGQKIAAHGGLNLSVLDGWWPEGYNGDNGWAIGPKPTGDYGTEDPEVQDREDAESLYTQLEEHVIPTFYDRDADDLPRGWIAKMREAMTGLPAPFSAKRMVIDYVEKMYQVGAEVKG